MRVLGRTASLLRNGHFWTVSGGLIGVVALCISAYQIVQASALQRESVEIDRRSQMAELMLSAHEAAFEFVAVMLSSDQLTGLFDGTAVPVSVDNTGEVEVQLDEKLITNELRTAFLKLDGAVSRGLLVEDKELISCLVALRGFASTLLESTIPMRRQIDAEIIVLALDEMPPIIKRYISGLPAPDIFLAMDEETLSGEECGEFSDVFDKI